MATVLVVVGETAQDAVETLVWRQDRMAMHSIRILQFLSRLSHNSPLMR